jgi:hypothetical protein
MSDRGTVTVPDAVARHSVPTHAGWVEFVHEEIWQVNPLAGLAVREKVPLRGILASIIAVSSVLMSLPTRTT